MKRKRKGSAMIWGVFLLIVFSLLILSGFEYSRIFAQMNMIHDTTSEGILSQVTVNAENVFSGVRESSGTARSFDELSWSELVNTDELYAYLVQEFDLTADGALNKEGNHQFTLNNIRIAYVNLEGNNLNITAIVSLKLPIYFAGNKLTTLNKDMKVRAGYEKRY